MMPLISPSSKLPRRCGCHRCGRFLPVLVLALTFTGGSALTIRSPAQQGSQPPTNPAANPAPPHPAPPGVPRPGAAPPARVAPDPAGTVPAGTVPGGRPAGDLDDELLQDLLPPPVRSSPPTPPRSPAAPPAAPPTAPRSPANPPDNEGEDIGNDPDARLRRILSRMESARRQLDQGDSSTATQRLQREVTAELDQLLARLESSNGEKAAAGAGASASATAKPGSTVPPSTEPPEGTADNPSPSTATPDRSATDPRTLGRATWADLPPQLQEPLLGAFPERFLPGFETQIEAYYRRLTERKQP
ncbi:MAG: hypothetical protein U0935_01090 [Pirellulales bacterium]